MIDEFMLTRNGYTYPDVIHEALRAAHVNAEKELAQAINDFRLCTLDKRSDAIIAIHKSLDNVVSLAIMQERHDRSTPVCDD